MTRRTAQNADLANMAQATIKGRAAGAGTGVPVDLTAEQQHDIIATFPTWDDVQVNLSNIKAPASDPPTWRLYNGCEVPAFGGGGTNTLYFSSQLTHKYKQGTDLRFHFHAAYPNTGAGNSRWTFTYSWANINGTFAAATSETIDFASAGVADKHVIHGFTAISGAGMLISSVLLCSLSRIGGHANDTYASDIYALSADFHIEIDTLGSKTSTTK